MASPETLYKIVTRQLSNDANVLQLLLCNPEEQAYSKPTLTAEMKMDICTEVYRKATFRGHNPQSLDVLQRILSNLDVLLEFLYLGHRRIELHTFFEAINDLHISKSDKMHLSHRISCGFVSKLRQLQTSCPKDLVTLGQNLASFLMDSGWYMEASNILLALDETFGNSLGADARKELNSRLLHGLSENRQFDKAGEILQKITLFNGALSASEACEVSNYHFWRSQYPDSQSWGLMAVKMIDSATPLRVIVDVLRQAGKASVVRRQFPVAQLLLCESLLYTKEVFGNRHLKYADCLVDYAFYLLNVDEVGKSVQAYEEALTIRESILGRNNLQVAKAYEELAYATYVHEYSSGHFEKAKRHAEAALNIMLRIIPSNHLLVASAQRVLALILEEIAIDMNDKKVSHGMLANAEQLHLSAVALSTHAFGEMNVQTAKHYGNLGRLYQTMERYSEAEQMHLKAIKIKEALLGRDDYEVALSIGHLASLYNYDLDEFNKAEELYLRSIHIAHRLFGPAYSGLEYDYRGLIRVYEETGDWNNFYKYVYMLRDWRELKNARDNENCQDDLLSGSKRKTARPIHQILHMIETSTKEAEGCSSKSTSTSEKSPSSSSTIAYHFSSPSNNVT